MTFAFPRKLAVGGVVTTTALVAGLLSVAPASAGAGDLRVEPSGVENTTAAAVLSFTTRSANLNFGGIADFSRLGAPSTFTVTIDRPTVPASGGTFFGTGVKDFTDVDGAPASSQNPPNVVGSDGPADAGTYEVKAEGNSSPLTPRGAGIDTCPSCFTVLSAGPVTVSSIAPSSLRPGAPATNVSLLGNNFERGSVIEVLRADGTVDTSIKTDAPPRVSGTAPGTTVPETDNITTRTELRRQWTVGANTIAGSRNVRVRNLDGNSATCTGCFFVAGAALAAVTPSAASNDPAGDLTVTFTGPSVTDGEMFLEFVSNPGSATRSSLTLSERSPATSTSTGTAITGTFNLSDAAPGLYQPVVRDSAGVVNACDCRFTVVQSGNRLPTLTSIDRTGSATGSSQPQGTTATYDVTGTNFSKGALVSVSGAGVTTTSVEFVSNTLLRATFQTTSTAATGARSVTVTLTDGKTVTRASSFTVTAAEPPATSTAGMFSFTRFAGTDRYSTAARIATGTFTRADTVLLANGQSDDPRTSNNESHFPDALAGSYLAGSRQAPTLLATETTLPQASRDALTQLAARNVVILGGTGAISTGVEEGLRRDGFTVTRIGGANRYETAKQVAETPASNTVGMDPNGDRTAVVASGQEFADALVAGPLGYAAKFPILITPTASLATETRSALQDLRITRVLIPGGTSAVSTSTENQIKALGITVERFGGQVRSQTATLVAAYAYDKLGFDRSHVELARGDQFPDALAGGPHGGVERAPILLTATPSEIGPSTRTFLVNRGKALKDGHIFGGTSAVSTAAEDAAEKAARDGAAA